jgi:glycosyltransferase involved in cell wall biosynthesis
VIVFFNEERFIDDAVQSILAQTYPLWELLLVDDGSTDSSTEVALSYADRFPQQIRYLSHAASENRGISASRNLGMQQARGAYLSYLDGDDALFPQAFSEQMEVLEARPEAAMVYGPIQWWYSWKGDAEDLGRDYIEELGVPPERVMAPPRLLPLFLRDKAAVPSGIMVRRAIAMEVGGFEDEFRGEYEDQVFCAKVALKFPIFAAGRCWYRYRQHPDSMVATALRSGATDASRRHFLEWLARYLAAQGRTSPAIRRALRLERLRFTHPTLFHLMRRYERRLDQIAGRRAS